MKFNFTINKIDDNQAVLDDGSGKIIYWPADKLPADAKVGDKMIFSIGEDDDSAKNILNEILGE